MESHLMKQHTKNYFQHFNLTGQEFLPCEVCQSEAVDLHHISPRGMGGASKLDKVENIMALCRKCHIEYGDKKHYKAFLYTKHHEKLFEYFANAGYGQEDKRSYDSNWILAQIYKYEFTCPVCKTMNCLNIEHLETYSKLLTSNIK